MQNPSGLHWHLDIGLCAPQEIETEVKYIHSTGTLAKTALLACHMQPFHQNKAFLCRHNSSPVLQLLWLGLCALKGIVQTEMEPNPAAGGDTATAASH